MPKHQRMSAKIEQFEHTILTMYLRGMTVRDIEEMCGIEVSKGSIFNIANAILDNFKEG